MIKKLVLILFVVVMADPSAFAQKTILVIRELDNAATDAAILGLMGSAGFQTSGGMVPGLGYTVVEFSDDDYTNDSFTSADGDLIFIMESSGSSSVRAHSDDALPIICMEPELVGSRPNRNGSLFFTDHAVDSFAVEPSGGMMNITNNSHEITSIFPTGNLVLWEGSRDRAYGFGGTFGAGVTLLGSIMDGATPRTSIGAIEAGGAMASTASAAESPAPARRAFFCAHTSATEAPTAEGALLIQRMIQWAIGDPVFAGGPQPPVEGTSGVEEWNLYK